jgi:DNA-binding PadR family transcriptional regulator
MAFLSKVEEIILLAVYKLKDNAYGLSIIEKVEKETGVRWLSGSVYGGLNRLKKNGYIQTKRVSHSGEQAGRPRVYYSLTKAGMDKLASAQKVTQRIWINVPDLEKGK